MSRLFIPSIFTTFRIPSNVRRVFVCDAIAVRSKIIGRLFSHIHTWALIIMFSMSFSSGYTQPYKVVVHVRTHNGKIPQASHASMKQYAVGSVVSIAPVRASNHTYLFTLEKPGTYWIRLAAAHHRAFSGPIVASKDSLLELEVRLGTLSAEMQHPDSVFLSGSFNDFSIEAGLVQMTSEKNGTYTAILRNEKDSVIYRPLFFVEGDRIPVDDPNGIVLKYDSDRHTVWAGGNFYTAIATRKKKVKVTIVPQRLVTTDLPASVSFTDPGKPSATLLTSYAQADFRLMKFRLAQYNFLETRQLGTQQDFIQQYDLGKNLSHFDNIATATSDKIVRDVFNIASFHFTPHDSLRAKEILPTIAPDAVVWRTGPMFTRPFLNALPDPIEAASLAEEIAAAQVDEGLKSHYLQFALEKYYEEDEENFVRMYNTFMRAFEGYPEFLEWVRSRNPIKRKIVVGKPMPGFSLVSMDYPTQVISPAALKGKPYLVDLWATWCMPCVAEMSTLHEAYRDYKESGFTIVSISFDEDWETVRRFRQKRWNMPWKNAMADQNNYEMLQNIFEYNALPRAILVNAAGIIVAIDDQIKGEKLERVLQNLIDK